MANTIAIVQTHRVSPKHAHVGLVQLSVVSTETYSAAGGGITIDISPQLTLLGIAWADVVRLSGLTAAGHVVAGTKTATSGQLTAKLWNGTTQIADGAINQTIDLAVWFSQGAVN